jgi:hypothetical protein
MDSLAAIAMILSLLPRWVSIPIGVVLAAAFLRWFFRRKPQGDSDPVHYGD